MRTWAWMLGGLILWTAHFLGVYLIASVADVVAHANHPLSRVSVAAFTLACLTAAGWVTLEAVRRGRRADDEMTGFAAAVAATGGAVSAVAILWQGLPAAVG